MDGSPVKQFGQVHIIDFVNQSPPHVRIPNYLRIEFLIAFIALMLEVKLLLALLHVLLDLLKFRLMILFLSKIIDELIHSFFYLLS